MVERFLLVLVLIAERLDWRVRTSGPKMRSVLLGHRVVVRGKNSAIEQPLDLLDPGVMEIVKDASVDAGPIVNGHDELARKSSE